MPFSLVAELPLGTYRASTSDGQPESLPSVSRLYSALLCAAGFGPRATGSGDQLRPCDADEALLRWLELNPPDEISIPPIQVNRGTATAYRDDGTLGKRSASVIVNKLGKMANVSVAVGGRLAWTWRSQPPSDIVAAFEALCPDVSHIGTTESPVRLNVVDDVPTPTHRLDLDASLFSRWGQDFDVPMPGRLDELTAAHRAAIGKPPTASRDRFSTSERSESPVPPRHSTAPVRYIAIDAPPEDVPWPTVFVAPISGRELIPDRDRVRYAVAAHRALISTMGEGSPPLITGVYPEGTRKPANRLALHFVDVADMDADARAAAGLSADCSTALAFMVPRDTDSIDTDVLARALRNLRGIWVLGRRVDFAKEAQEVSGARFWREPETGTNRLWRTSPPAVPDTRGNAGDWTFGHAALLSLGFVWLGTMHVPRPTGRGDARNRVIVEAALDAGAVALSATPLRTTAVHDYVHHVNEHAVVRPYHALLHAGALGGNQAIQAIGQSRHLGGGLLLPVDIPDGAALDASSMVRIARGRSA